VSDDVSHVAGRILTAQINTMRRRGGRTTSAAAYLAQGWRQEACPQCAGRGVAYARRDGDPRRPITGMEFCKACDGRGSTWLSPQGYRAPYPGGPWMTR
jgi:hypothetical protein